MEKETVGKAFGILLGLALIYVIYQIIKKVTGD